jgi:hypothetical protein
MNTFATWCEEHAVKELEKTLYIHRPLTNPEPFLAWAKEAGFTNLVVPEDLHVTICYSKTPVDWENVRGKGLIPGAVTIENVQGRKVMVLGVETAVLKFESASFKARWEMLNNRGCSHDYPTYLAHVSFASKGSNLDLSTVDPYMGPLEFGPEIFAELDENWTAKEE